MALGKACKLAVLGRVIYPAEVKYTQNGNVFLNFGISVDGLAKDKNDRSQRNSAKILCSYRVNGDPATDMVVGVLCNILNKDTGQGSLGGNQYKSVEVLVEGDLVLVETEGPGHYVNLDFCRVNITDNTVINWYRQATGAANNYHQAPQQPQQQPQVNLGPVGTVMPSAQQPAQWSYSQQPPVVTQFNQQPQPVPVVQQPVVQQPQPVQYAPPQPQQSVPQQNITQPTVAIPQNIAAAPRGAQMVTVGPAPTVQNSFEAEAYAAAESLAANSKILTGANNGGNQGASIKTMLEGNNTPSFQNQNNPLQ